MGAGQVQLVDCPPELQEPLRAALLTAGLEGPQDCPPGPTALLVWLDPRSPAAPDRLRNLRHAQPGSLPVLIVVAPASDTGTLAAAAAAGADAVICSADAAHLAAVTALALGSARRFLGVSPLTGLPGNTALQHEIARRLPDRGGLALLAFDLDEFKAYNDRYGYARGDDLLRFLREVLLTALEQCAGAGCFAAHIGGDDFFALVRPEEACPVAERVLGLWAAGVAAYYEPDDRARGCITVRTRGGEVRQVPLATLTVAAVTNEADDLTHPGQLAAVLAELKAYGKSLRGSVYVPDRRRTHQ